MQPVIQLKEYLVAQKICPVCTELEIFLTNSIILGFCVLEAPSPLITADALTQKYFQV